MGVVYSQRGDAPAPETGPISPPENPGRWWILFGRGEDLHLVSRRNSARISDCAWSGSHVFDEGRFGIECSGHGALPGEYQLAPLRAEFLRTLSDIVFQKDLVRRSTL